MPDPETRLLGDEDLDEFFDVRAQSFGESGGDRERWKSRLALDPAAVAIGAFAGRDLVGALRVFPVGQFLVGRPVPMGAVAAVVVRPEARGRGVAKSLLTSALEWMRAHGRAVTSLHPASTRVYRSMGWEHAGRAGWARVPTRSLAALAAGATRLVARIGADGNEEIRDCFAADAIGRHGPVQRSAAWWAFIEAVAQDVGAFTYGARDAGGRLLGYVRYTQIPSRSWGYSIRVEDFVAGDPDSAAALWRFLGGHAMQVERIAVPEHVVPGLVLLLPEQDVETVALNRWMHRIVDLPAVAAARGFPVGVRGAVTFRVTDPWPGGVGGTWRLEVADGAGAVVSAADAAVALDVGALSALSVGGASVDELRRAGRIEGPADELAVLGTLLAAPQPVMTDEF